MKRSRKTRNLLLIGGALTAAFAINAFKSGGPKDAATEVMRGPEVEVIQAVDVEVEQSADVPEFEVPEATVFAVSMAGDGVKASDYQGVLDLLDTLPIEERVPDLGIDSDPFGEGWADLDSDGCDTRNEILARDLTDAAFKEGTDDCEVISGGLADPYMGTPLRLHNGTGVPSSIQVDHVVSLGDAWQKGGKHLTEDLRIEFANDPLNLLVVDGRASIQKRGRDAAAWLPANEAFRCDYVSTQVLVKAKYSLWVTQPERDAIADVLTSCIEQEEAEAARLAEEAEAARLAEEAEAARLAEEAEAARLAEEAEAAHLAEEAALENVFYANCTEARAAGVTPIYEGQPGYSLRLDRDRDGIACE